MRFAIVTLSAVALAALAGCSEPVPQSADGAFFVALVSPDEQTCMIEGHTAEVGAVDAQNRTAVVTDGSSLIDGGAVTHVTCNVVGTTSFDVNGLIDDTANTGNELQILIPSISASASQASPATGNIVFAAPWTAGNGYQGSCNFWFTPMTPETVDITGGAGRVWVTFSCAALVSGQSTCPIQTGYAIFENCLTTPPAM